MDECLRKKSAHAFEYERCHGDKTNFYSVAINTLGKNRDGRWIFAYVAQDLTSLRLSERALARSKELFQAAQNFAQLGTWEVDIASEHVTWSSSFERLLDLPENSGPKSFQEFMALVHPKDREFLSENIQT